MNKTIKQILEERKANDYNIKFANPLISIKDIDTTKRIVTGFYNSFYYFDADQDVVIPGATAKSIADRGPGSQSIAKIKHAKNHDLTKIPGRILRLSESERDGIYGTYFETKIAETTLGNDTLIEYQEGIIDNHSIGFLYEQLELIIRDEDPITWDKWIQQLVNPEDANEVGYMFLVKEINLFEGSSVAFGANPLTPFLGVKSQEGRISYLNDRLTNLEKSLRNGKQSEETLYLYSLQCKQIKQILKNLTSTEPDLKDTLLKEREPSKQFTQEIIKGINQISINF